MTTRRQLLQTLGALPAALTLPAWAATPNPARQALVIGNSRYLEAPLTNPVNDAKAMSELLSNAGFTVSTHLDAKRVDMLGAIEDFSARVRLPATQQVFVFFAGHGAQLDWRNYLLPVDAKADTAAQLRQSCVDLNQLIGELSRAKGKTFIIMLDACRNNPFGSSYQPEQKGLSQFDAPVGSLLAYATSPGNVASDGSGKNGLYTENLIRELSVRGARIEDALKRVRLNVRLSSGGAQIPWETTSLESDVFIFDSGVGKLSEADQERQMESDLAAWGRVKNSTRAQECVDYLREFPNGRFAEIVQSRLTRLLAEREAAKPVAVGPSPAASHAPSASQAATENSEAPESDGPVIHTSDVVAATNKNATIRLGPGLPVPQFMAPNLNPYSAGSYPLARKFSVGDVIVQERIDYFTKVKLAYLRNEVTRVDNEANRVEFNHGTAVTDLMGNVMKSGNQDFEAPVQLFPAELRVGKKWRAAARGMINGQSDGFYYDFKITRRETITVPAGTFDTFVMEGQGFSERGGQITTVLWVVPGLNAVVQRERINRNRMGQIRVAEIEYLVEAVQGGVDAQCAAPAKGVAQRNLVIRNSCG
jgi:hypothetical protein